MEKGMRVGFIGLGIMGRSMSRNLHAAGFDVTVWNRTRSKMEEAVRWGARSADSPRELAASSDVVITMVGDTPDVGEVVQGPDGILSGAYEGLVWIDMSTISPDATRQLAKDVAERGVRMLDAPVSGGDVGARNGTLSIMVGGERDVLDEVEPVLQAMGSSIIYCGPAGAGQTVKACNQIMCGLNLLGMVEALTLAKKAGIDLNTMIQVTRQGAAGSWALSHLGPRVVQGDLEPGFSVQFQQKDLRIVLEEAERLGLPVVGTALVNQLLRSVQAHGGDEDGTHALITVMERLANIRVTSRRQ